MNSGALDLSVWTSLTLLNKALGKSNIDPILSSSAVFGIIFVVFYSVLTLIVYSEDSVSGIGILEVEVGSFKSVLNRKGDSVLWVKGTFLRLIRFFYLY